MIVEMGRHRQKKGKDISKLFLVVLAVVVVVEAVLVLYKRPDWLFMIKETAQGFFRSSELEQAEGIAVTEWTMEELLDTKTVIREDSLLLINKEHLIPSDFSDVVEEYKNSGVMMDPCIMSSYEALSAECRRKFDEQLYISSSYRTKEKQQEILETSAPNIAAEVGASEHQAGLALDVYFSGHAGRAILKCEAGQYLNQNCWRYGFIIRYPLWKSSKTSTAYEPWHIRYVGVPHAEIMYLEGLVLEEYMELLLEEEYYRYGDYLITRQEKEPFLLPESFESGIISKDNMGGYVITLKLGDVK